MRIGIDARLYGSMNTGIGIYIKKLLENLEKEDLVNEYTVFLKKDNFNEYQPQNKNFKKQIANCNWYSFAEQIFLPLIIRKAKVDIMHFPHFNVPFFYKKPFVVSVHDLQLFHFGREKGVSTLPRWFYLFKLFCFKFIIKRAIINARKVITFAEYTKNQIIEILKVNKDKIEVIYEGCGEKIQNGKTIDLKLKGITKPYLFYIGTAYPHKNLKRLLKAFKLLLEKDGFNYQLVIGGKEDYFCNELKKEAMLLNLWKGDSYKDNKVVFLGFVKDEEKKSLYKNAILYVFPSLMEGFGFTPLEAMKEGVPVLSSKNSCLPEILGNSVYYFNAEDVQDVCDSMFVMLKDSNLRLQFIEKGLKQFSLYSWEKTAKQTLKLYNTLN